MIREMPDAQQLKMELERWLFAVDSFELSEKEKQALDEKKAAVRALLEAIASFEKVRGVPPSLGRSIPVTGLNRK